MSEFILKKLEERNKSYELTYRNRLDTLPLAEGVTCVADVPCIKDRDCPYTMDIYFPTEHAGALPVVFDFHGGGLVAFYKGFNRWFCAELASHGFLVFCIDYPLAPENKVYDILRHAYAGVAAAYSMVWRYGGDPDRLYLCGDSAGGFIATYLAAIQKSEKIASSLGIPVAPFSFRAMSIISGMFYSCKLDKHGIFLLRKTYYGDDYRKQPFRKYVNPENKEVVRDLPPALLITSDHDDLRDYTMKYALALHHADNPVRVADYHSGETELTHDFVCAMPDRPETHSAIRRIAAFFNLYQDAESAS